ncbi:hypothetical protein RND81_08G144800 [Saponaria officinalis]|uniref:Phosphatidylinositol-glycan biosynthesis class X protein n=1 Tax=Saponaria officinalis TaxID=3572 RepID=A0AAW1J8Z4_SAPOF
MWAILVILGFSIYFGSSNQNQESDHDFSVEFNKHTISSVACIDRYVMDPYFRQHDGNIDLDLQDYIKHKIASASDKISSKLLVLERHLIGEGSHRRLSSSIKFSVQHLPADDFSSQICEVVIIERLPCGVFADPFELDHIVQRGAYKDASVFGDINLELPSFLSNQSLVEIHLDAALNISADKEIVKEFKLEIPLHARYPRLQASGYSTVRFSDPDLFFRCKMNDDAPAQTCLLTPISGNYGLKVNDFEWSIPAGIEAHAGIVSVVTFTTALLSVILIAVASFKVTRTEPDTRVKES